MEREGHEPNSTNSHRSGPTAQQLPVWGARPDLYALIIQHDNSLSYRFDGKWNKHTFLNVKLSCQLEMPTFYNKCRLEDSSEC